MPSGCCMTEQAAVAAISAAIAAIAPAERTPNAVLMRLKRTGYPIGKTRMMRLIQAYGLQDAPLPPPVQAMALVDLHAKAKAHADRLAKSASATDVLASLDGMAQDLLAAVGPGLKTFRAENLQQVMLAARTGVELVRISIQVRQLLATSDRPRSSASAAPDAQRIMKEILAKYASVPADE